MQKKNIFLVFVVLSIAGIAFAALQDTIFTSRGSSGKVTLAPRNASGVQTSVLEADYQKVVIPSPLPLNVNTINEASSANGVLIDGVLLKDNLVSTTGAVNSTSILDGTIVNVDVSSSAAIAGTKISPAFGAQNISATGTLTLTGDIAVNGTNGSDLPHDCLWDVGSAAGTATARNACDVGTTTYAMSGGCDCFSGSSISSYPSSATGPVAKGDAPSIATGWTCDCSVSTTITVYALCCNY
jgi:hypothetical protein